MTTAWWRNIEKTHSDLTAIVFDFESNECSLNLNAVWNQFSSLPTVFSYSLNSSKQQLVEIGHVQQVKTEEVSVEDSSQDGRSKK